MTHAVPDPEPEAWSVRDLRRRWKPIKNGLASAEGHSEIRVRLHRCWSWLQRIEDLDKAGLGADDPRLIYAWIAMNSLYGRWDDRAREPVSDRHALDTFCRRLLERDRDRRIAGLLTAQRELVKAIAGDEYLSRYFWQDPGEGEARRAQNHARHLGSWYVEGRFGAVLDLVLQRVYMARCQLVHGAATYDSRLNRQAVHQSAGFLCLFLQAASLVIIDHVWAEDWSGLCYPPIDPDGQLRHRRVGGEEEGQEG